MISLRASQICKMDRWCRKTSFCDQNYRKDFPLWKMYLAQALPQELRQLERKESYCPKMQKNVLRWEHGDTLRFCLNQTTYATRHICHLQEVWGWGSTIYRFLFNIKKKCFEKSDNIFLVNLLHYVLNLDNVAFGIFIKSSALFFLIKYFWIASGVACSTFVPSQFVLKLKRVFCFHPFHLLRLTFLASLML